jgi:hypothetical protein
MEHCFGDRRFFWLAPVDWSMLLAGIAAAALLLVLV